MIILYSFFLDFLIQLKEVIGIPAILDKCVEKLKKQGKSESSAFAICTTALKKSGKMDDQLIEQLIETELRKDKHMKTKSKKKGQPEISHRFSFPVSEKVLSSFELAEKDKPIDIQGLKKGKFRHPWWGVLTFNDEFFNNLISNFERNVPQEEISFDFQHRPDWGAAAWVKKLFIKDDAFMASVFLTEKGRESIKKKEFKYFSLEYTDNYTDYVFDEEVDEDGETVERETKVSYGPALLGGGLTNRPFIKGMKPVSLSEAGEEVVLEEIFEDKEVNEEMKKKLEDLEKEQKKLTEQIKKLAEAKDEESEAKTKELQDKLNGVEEDLKTFKEADEKTRKKEKDRELEEKKEKDRKLKEMEKAKDKKLQEAEGKVKELSDRLDKMGESVKKLMKSNEILEEDKVEMEVKAKLGEIKKLGIFPSTLKIVTSLMEAKETRTFSVKLSETEEGKDPVEKTFSFGDAIYEILNSIPKDHRFTESEESETETTPSGKKKLSVEEVEAYAAKHEISFDEAYVKLDPKGEQSE